MPCIGRTFGVRLHNLLTKDQACRAFTLHFTTVQCYRTPNYGPGKVQSSIKARPSTRKGVQARSKRRLPCRASPRAPRSSSDGLQVVNAEHSCRRHLSERRLRGDRHQEGGREAASDDSLRSGLFYRMEKSFGTHRYRHPTAPGLQRPPWAHWVPTKRRRR